MLKKRKSSLYKHKGQLNLLALIAFVSMIFIAVYVSTFQSTAEQKIEKEKRVTLETRDSIEEIKISLETEFINSIYSTADEMARHGGFTKHNIPRRHHHNIPYYVEKGKIINIPAIKVMEQMMNERIKEMIQEELFRRKSDTFAFGVPDITSKIDDSGITVTLHLEMKATVNDLVQKIPLRFQKQLLIRLKKLRDLAAEYAKQYKVKRHIEKNLLNGIIQDSRIPSPPGMFSKAVECDSKTIYMQKHQLSIPMKENALLASTLEHRRLSKEFINESDIEWSFELDRHFVNFTLIANKDQSFGGKKWESNDVIYLVPIETPHLDMDLNPKMCGSKYFVSYEIVFPVKMSITDLMKNAQMVGIDPEAEIRPLTYSFYVKPYTKGLSYDMVDDSIKTLEEIDDICQGECSFSLSISNSDKGNAWLDSCQYQYSTGKLILDDIKCGGRILTVESKEPPAFSRKIEPINVEAKTENLVQLSPFSTLSGTVFLANKIFCTNTNQLVEKEGLPAKYIEGHPPRFIELYLSPLNKRLGSDQYSIADEKGYYEFRKINPGKYLLVAKPSLGTNDVPTYKAQVFGTIIEIIDEKVHLDIVLEPIYVELYKNEYVFITSKEIC